MYYSFTLVKRFFFAMVKKPNNIDERKKYKNGERIKEENEGEECTKGIK